MSAAVEDCISPTSSSTQRSYFQNPNPKVHKHPTDSGIFNNSFNPMNFKLDFDCSNDAAATVRSSRRKPVKVKKHSNCSGSVSTSPVSGTCDAFGLMFNTSNHGSVLNSNLGQTENCGNGEQQGIGEFLDLNMGDTNNSKLAKKMGSEGQLNSRNIFHTGNLNFDFGADEAVHTRKVSERGSSKFGELNGMGFVFGANMNNGVMKPSSSNNGHEYGPDGAAMHVDESESRGTVGTSSGIDAFMKPNMYASEADSDLVNSLSNLNLGTRGPGDVGLLVNDNSKAEEENTSYSRNSANTDFVFSANLRDIQIQTDSNSQKEESKEKVEKLVPDGKGEMKLDANFVFGTSEYSRISTEDAGEKDLRTSSTKKLSDDSVNSHVDSGIMFGNNKVNGVFHIGNQEKNNSSFKARKKLGDDKNILRSKREGSCDYLKKQCNNIDSVHDCSLNFGCNLGNAFSDSSKVLNETKIPNIHDPVKVSTTNKINDSGCDPCSSSNNVFVFGSDKRNISRGRFDEVNKVPAFDEKRKSDTATKVYSFSKTETFAGSDGVSVEESESTIGLGFVPKVHNAEASPTNRAGTTNDYSFLTNVGGFGTSFTGFNTPDINLASSFTSDMFLGLGKKLEFSKSNSVGQRKLKKTKVKLRQQGRNCQRDGHNCLSKEAPHSFEESSECSPMDVSPYCVTDFPSISADPATYHVNNEDAVDTTDKLSAKNSSSSSAKLFADADVSARQRPHQKKYKMKTDRGLEFLTPKDVSRAHKPTSEEQTKASVQEICEKWRKRGNQAYKNGDISEAEVCYSKGISSLRHSETPGFCIEPLLLCYSNRAATRMALGRMREGLKDCRMAAALDPSFIKANLRSGNCYLLLGELEDACYNYNKCLESENIICLDRRITIEAADGLQKAKKVADYLKLSAELLLQKTYESVTNALRIIDDALSLSYYSEELLNMKGEALLVLGKHKEVVQLCEQTLDSAEKNFDCKNSIKLWRWKLLSKSYFHLGRLEIALEFTEKYEQLATTADKSVDPEDSLIHLAVTIRELLQCKNAGNEAFQGGKYTEAVEHYTAAISKSVESHSFAAVCFCNRAAAHQSLGEVIDAIGDCSTAIALDGSYPKALSRRATLWETIRDYKHAADDLQRLISILEAKSGENPQKSATQGKTTNGSVKDLRRARRRLSSVEENAKKERSLDLYLILGLKSSDAASEVKKAYRKAALRHHPDKAGQVFAKAESGIDGQQWKVITESIQMDADRLFKMIGEAYAVLSDSTKRSKYDLEEEMWDDMNINVASSSRRASDFYSSPFETPNRRNSQESRKGYTNSRYYYWEDLKRNYHDSYPRW